jgi:hypothetical protein
MSFRAIAEGLDRSPSTVCREVSATVAGPSTGPCKPPRGEPCGPSEPKLSRCTLALMETFITD